MKNLPFKLLSLAMLLSMIASPVVAVALKADEGDLSAQGIEPPVRPDPELVPEEIRELFKDGMSVEEFLDWNQGPIPNAIAEYVDLPLTVIVQLDQPGLIAMKQRPDRGVGFDDADYVNQLLAVQDTVINQIKSISSDAVVMGQYTKVLNGFMARIKATDLDDIRLLAGVKSVSRAPEHTIDIAYSAPLTKSDLVWQLGETGYTGRDVTVAVIDTGIDYTHAMFGTLGDPAAYTSNDPDIIEAGTFPTPKVIGGYDFAGTNYDAGGNYGSPVPVPDPDPIDEGGHGTHVASTVAGVNAGFGSGMAPDAKLYALKVFGAEGSTNLVIDAIEWAMDPNGDGYIDDHVDVINMSLGSSFGPALEDDPEYLAVEAANAAGVMVVASAGNAGNNSYITGSPGNTDSALAVAASTTGFETLPYISYNSGSEKIPYTTSYNPFTTKITADLVDVDAIDGEGTGLLCSTEGVGDLTGKIALIQRGTCSFYIKINNAEALGADAAIIFNNQPGTISMNTTGSTLPAGSILQSDGLLLKSLAPLMVSVGPDSNVETFISNTPADTIATFSSRGPRGFDSMLKPEITAPGVAIFAANMGSGDKGVSMSGTSMAAPHIAGIASLMKEAHPTWTNEQIKAALMNTAVDLADPVSAEIPRQGAGRVDAFAAVTTDVVAIADSKFVSMNWGVVEVTEDTFTGVKTVTLRNFSDTDVTLDVGSLFTSDSTGATLTPAVETVTIPAFGKATVDFTLVLDMRQMPIDFAEMEEFYGYVTFTSADTNLRVPFYVVPRPYTEITELDSDTNIELEDTGWIDLEQSGPVASSLWGFPVTMVSDNDPDVIDMADLRYVGMDYGWFSADYGDILVPSFAMWDDQHTLQPYWSEVDLWVYGDAAQPVVDFNYNYGSATGGYPNNDWIVLQIDYNDGGVYLGSPYFIYTDYNSGFQEWYLPAPYQYITDDFVYEVVSYDWYGTSDYAGAGEFDITKPPFWVAPVTYDDWMDFEFVPFNEMFSLIFEVYDSDGYELSQPEGVMLVDYFGKPGVGQAYFWPVNIVEAPLFNEFSISTTGTDVEYIELIGNPEVEYDLYTILEIEGDGSGAGYIDEVIPVGTTNANGLWLEDLAPNSIENGTVTLLLVKDFIGSLGDDLDINNDGVLDTEPWSEIADVVAVKDFDTADLTYGEPVLEPNYDGVSTYAPGGASRYPDGMDTDTIDDWVRNDFDLAGITGYTGTPVFGEAYNTPGEFNRIVPFELYLPIIMH
jgi:subtilisin family serine protease